MNTLNSLIHRYAGRGHHGQRSPAMHFLLCLLCLMPVAAFAQPFSISADGNEVTDLKTGLIWRRCAEGKSWDGSACAGTAGIFTHEAALQRAAAQASSNSVAWRLPNVKELASIADLGRSNPAIDPTAFPDTWANGYWSASPRVNDATEAWYIHFSYGYAQYDLRSRGYQVRLVRTPP